MVVAYPTADPVVPSSVASPARQGLSRTQQALLLLVNAVSDLRDEEDLQCLAFLAGELGILRHTPFYFSRGSGSRLPHSVVLDDTLRVSISAGLIGRESGGLRAYAAPEARATDAQMTAGISWLSMLAPDERVVLTHAVLNLHAGGIHTLSSSASAPFKHAVLAALESADDAENVERRLRMVRLGLSAS
jgi:hypothetical protein